jgi:para-nitrobenzyl esterase
MAEGRTEDRNATPAAAPRRRGRRWSIVLGVLVVVLGLVWMALRALVPGAPEPPPPPSADASSRRLLPAGEVVGFVGPAGSHVWAGLPYAAPPVGDRRWRPAVPAPRWSAAREALAFGSHCVQLPSPFGGVDGDPQRPSGSEDCLFLNVYAPRFEPGDVPTGAASRPVLVWIHGGGNVIGLADRYDGGVLAARENVVVVTVNYRLGPLGWFRHAALREADASPEERSGNFGTLDLVRALEWVRDNIAGFGGDPERVTIFGESAGGTNVFTLLLAPQARGLFHRAIAQSGGTRITPVSRAENWSDDADPGHERSAGEIAARLWIAAGRAEDRAAARTALAALPPQQLATFLRERTPEQLFDAYRAGDGELLLDLPRVFGDGAVLPAGDPLERFARPDGWNRVPVLVGTNRDENKLFLFPQPLYTKMWFGILPSVRDPEQYLAVADAMSAMWKATGADGPADALWRTQPDVFVYRFDFDEWPKLLSFDAATFLGAAHGFEIPFVFGHWDLGPRGRFLFDAEHRPVREELSDAMRSYWAQFATSGRPDRGLSGALPEWKAWDGRDGAPKTMVFDTPAGGGIRMIRDSVTPEAVLASVESDPRLTTQRDRCWVYRELATRPGDFGPEDYPNAGRDGCVEFPFDEFPWP